MCNTYYTIVSNFSFSSQISAGLLHGWVPSSECLTMSRTYGLDAVMLPSSKHTNFESNDIYDDDGFPPVCRLYKFTYYY